MSKYPMTEITELEKGIIAKLATASYPSATASKRFVCDLSAGYVKQLSDRGRAFLAFVAHRFRRQYKLDADELAWVEQWKKPSAGGLAEGAQKG